MIFFCSLFSYPCLSVTLLLLLLLLMYVCMYAYICMYVCLPASVITISNSILPNRSHTPTNAKMKAEVGLMVLIGLGCLVSQVRLDTAKPSGDTKDTDKSKESLRATKLPPCAACRVLTESFNKV